MVSGDLPDFLSNDKDNISELDLNDFNYIIPKRLNRGLSVTDYAIISYELLNHILYFNVEHPNCFSDHGLIKLNLKITYSDPNKNESVISRPLNLGYVWNDMNSVSFTETMQTPLMQCEINTSGAAGRSTHRNADRK